MVAAAKLFDAQGRAVVLGRELGRGGEGSVFDLPAAAGDLVAKLYHATPDAGKQRKLQSMAAGADDALRQVAAWPVGTLHRGAGGPVCGFLMPKVVGYEPVHKLYSPAHRKQQFPEVGWGGLVLVARNTAAAFATVHAHGHVIGDVNQGNILVARTGLVKLIDCDSFQISAGGKVYPCEVGVEHFTPPEVLEKGTFRGVVRTPDHDNFGLAVVCFHLLFLGRHPFAGVYSGAEDMPIEKAIRTHRFAFGRDAAAGGMSPPPNTVGLATVSPGVAGLFEQAFGGPASRPGGRPSAAEWFQALDALAKGLRVCADEPAHTFHGGLTACPWCALEKSSGVLFFIGAAAGPAGITTFKLAVVWKKIAAVKPPGPAPVPDPGQYRPAPRPLSGEFRRRQVRSSWVRGIASAAAVVALLFAIPDLGLMCTGGIFLGLFVYGVWYATAVDPSGERLARQKQLEQARLDWDRLLGQWAAEASPAAFDRKREELERAKAEHKNLDAAHRQAKQQLHDTMKARQLHQYLDGFFIDRAAIPNIGPSRKATLASFGVETAADVDRDAILTIKGFGPGLTDNLVRWRRELEKGFHFDPAKGVPAADLAAIENRFRARRAQLEHFLSAGPGVLAEIRSRVLARRQSLAPQLEAAARRLAQAAADRAAV